MRNTRAMRRFVVRQPAMNKRQGTSTILARRSGRRLGSSPLECLVGLPGFEPGTSCTPSKHANAPV